MQSPAHRPSHTATAAKAAFLCVFVAAFIGASTNAVNGALSPEYYRAVLRWDFPGIWAASIAQGIMEGVLYGVLFAVIILLAVLFFRRDLTWPALRHHILKAAGLVYLAWLAGGVISLLLACVSPDFYRNIFRDVPPQLVPLMKFAWVGGSIQGAVYGGLISAIVTAIGIKNDHHIVPPEGAG
jgi:prolipoprotein diacylglyceryltransferase